MGPGLPGGAGEGRRHSSSDVFGLPRRPRAAPGPPGPWLAGEGENLCLCSRFGQSDWIVKIDSPQLHPNISAAPAGHLCPAIPFAARLAASPRSSGSHHNGTHEKAPRVADLHSHARHQHLREHRNVASSGTRLSGRPGEGSVALVSILWSRCSPQRGRHACCSTPWRSRHSPRELGGELVIGPPPLRRTAKITSQCDGVV